jgi:TonB-dependent starch-binding outer membrane protein SusC
MKTNLKLYRLGAQGATRLFATLSLFTLAFVLITSLASAQTKTITGIIRDEQQQVLAGASVSVKGTSQGVLTDTDGRFSITLTANDKTMLVFSYMGKKTVDLSVAERTHFDITLYEDFTEITEVVVLGAGADDELYSETKPAKKSSRKAKKRSL